CHDGTCIRQVVTKFCNKIHRRQHFPCSGCRTHICTASTFYAGVEIDHLPLCKVGDFSDTERRHSIRIFFIFHVFKVDRLQTADMVHSVEPCVDRSEDQMSVFRLWNINQECQQEQ